MAILRECVEEAKKENKEMGMQIVQDFMVEKKRVCFLPKLQETSLLSMFSVT